MKRFKVRFDERVVQTVTFYVEADDLETAEDTWRTADWEDMSFHVTSSDGTLDGLVIEGVKDE